MAVQPGDPSSSDGDEAASRVPGVAVAPRVEKPILYIDAYRLTRDCIARELSVHLPEVVIESIVTVDHLAMPDVAENRFGLAILHTHTARIGEAHIATQVSLMSRAAPRLPLVLLSDVDEVDAIVEAFRLGARGYITTRQSMIEAAEAIRFVRAGGAVVPWSALKMAEQPGPAAEHGAAGTSLPVKFTPRQLDVLTRLWQGKPNKAIAFELEMSESTVKVHIQHIMKKLHATNRTQVVLMTRPAGETGDLGSGVAWLRRH